LIIPRPGRRIIRIPRPVFERVMHRLTVPQRSEQPYMPIKFRVPEPRVLDSPNKARRYSEEDRRKCSEIAKEVWARRKARWAAASEAKRQRGAASA
jgi:hypothetical protein